MSKINSIIKYLSIIGIAFSIYLVVRELLQKGYCPDFFGTPACWLVLLAFVIVFFSTLLKKGRTILFYPGSVLGLVLAIYFSVSQLLKIKSCPIMFGIPLCYVSLITFASMIILFVFQRRMNKNRKVKKGEV
jgi:hypothetical protein